MLYVIKNGKFTGTRYEEDDIKYREFHASQGEICAWIEGDITDQTISAEELKNYQTAFDAEKTRQQELENARGEAGLKGVTVQQAYAFIDNKIDGATTTAETVEAIRTILKKMVPYILI